MMNSFPRFQDAINHVRIELKDNGDLVHSRRWQGIEIAQNPNMACLELQHVHLQIPMDGYEEDLEAYAKCIEPDLPWADAHFEERVSGYPMNPGTEFKNWPWNKGRGAESFLDRRGKFNHNYMERYWPKYAAVVKEPTASASDFRSRFKDYFQLNKADVMEGIMYPYGDLKDVVDLMLDDPLTRQAILPVWFPEDTGGGAKRAPCTISYHFMMRNDRLSVNYHIRSCDFVKHFRNDLYLTVRLVIWMLQQLRSKDPRWKDVRVGDFIMQIGSLHSFKPDWELI